MNRAYYFGCWDRSGHYLHDERGRLVYDLNWQRDLPGFPWTLGHLDTGLLKNGKRTDVIDGRVFWTCGATVPWFGFFWWDRSVDSRGNSNSGFYVSGFDLGDRETVFAQATKAFTFACDRFPDVVLRQRCSLVLQP